MRAPPKLAIFSLYIFCFVYTSLAGQWFEELRPGTTRSEIIKIAGSPDFSAGSLEVYKQPQGRIKCTYDGERLLGVVFDHPSKDTVSWSLYSTDGMSTDADLKQREAYLSEKNFIDIPRFSGRCVYAHKYCGSCYEVGNKYIVVEPVVWLGGGSGYLTNKAARVLVVDADGNEEVLYRACDHWDTLKPSTMTEHELEQRTHRIREAVDSGTDVSISNILGREDSRMGCGIDYRLYYIRGGLLIANNGLSGPRKMAGARIFKPGLGNLSVTKWLAEQEVMSKQSGH